jgi:hypothetical protein
MYLPFIRGLFATPRDTINGSSAGWYKPIRVTSDSNLVNAFESLHGPPNLDLVGRGMTVGPSKGPQGAAFMPMLSAEFNATTGFLNTAAFVGGGPLYTSEASAPEQEIF